MRALRYKAPSLETAERLFHEIKQLLVTAGGFYARVGVNRHAETSILFCLAKGQFLYKKNAYFICWSFHGRHMRIEECGVVGGGQNMAEIRRKIRKRCVQGVSWRREKTGREIAHHGQKGA